MRPTPVISRAMKKIIILLEDCSERCNIMTLMWRGFRDEQNCTSQNVYKTERSVQNPLRKARATKCKMKRELQNCQLTNEQLDPAHKFRAQNASL